jgi:uncharacterized membrane protein
MSSRFKNYGLWVSIIAFIPMLLKGFNIDILPANFDSIGTSLLGILVLLGIINNPQTDNKGFLDDKKDATDEETKIEQNE